MPPSQPDDLQFDRAEPATSEAAAPPACSACNAPIVDTYYAVGNQMLCPSCRAQVDQWQTGGSGVGRFVKATLYGLLAAAGAALIWWGVRRLTGYEVGLIAIAVGLMVGGAVRVGSGRRGGIGYQLLAVALTYGAIASTYVPDVIHGLREAAMERREAPTSQPASTAVEAGDPATAAADPSERPPKSAGMRVVGWTLLIVVAFIASLAMPFFAGMQSIIWLLIIGFALWEAWKLNRRVTLEVSGPFTLATPPAPSST